MPHGNKDGEGDGHLKIEAGTDGHHEKLGRGKERF